MQQKHLLTILTILMLTTTTIAQDINLSGRVLDERAEPMIGVSVVAKGTTIGNVTDVDGRFTISVPAATTSVVFSYIGYEAKEVKVSDIQKSNAFSLRMTNAEIGLNQVVVSASKKREKLLDAPASISVINHERIENQVVTSSVEYLKGTPGVDVIQQGLVANNVVVRGFNNIFSGAVLNVVDNRIGAVPSLRVNAYELIPTSNLDIDRIEVLRGPASALYGPNASSGVIHIMTKSPLEQEKKFETAISIGTGFTVQGSQVYGTNSATRTDSTNTNSVVYSIFNPEFRHSGKLLDGKFGYKISGSYFQGKDFTNYDSREPYQGDTLVFGSVRGGGTFIADSVTRTMKGSNGKDSSYKAADTRPFKKDFQIQKYTFDARVDIKPTKDILIILNGGIARSSNIELTGLGAGQAKGWLYWYAQARFKWRNLFLQYFINSSDANGTYLIPQLLPSSRVSSTSASPYQVQRLIDRSALHVVQVQHSFNPMKTMNLVYGADAMFTIPKTDSTINGRFEGGTITQVGGYIQGDYDPLQWLKLVAAFRLDYNSVIKNVAWSPRVAIAFKPKPGHTVRLTYNRAFDSPTSLNEFLDLANGKIPNGIYLRGIGNPNGYNYQYDQNGNIQYITALWDSTHGNWVTYGDKTNNYQYLEKNLSIVAQGIVASSGGQLTQENAINILHAFLKGVVGPDGLIQKVNNTIIDYAQLAQYGSVIKSKPTDYKNLPAINNQITQTLELGYKGLLFSKLQVQTDLYWTRISNFVTPLVTASGSVVFDFTNPNDPITKKIIDTINANVAATGPLLQPLVNSIDGSKSATNPNITKPVKGSIADELLVILTQLPIGTVTPRDGKVGSDYILTYKNVGRLDVFGADIGVQYQLTPSLLISGSFSWVDKDKITLSTGELVSLNAPKLKGSMGIDYKMKKIGIGIGGTWRWQDAYWASSAVYVGSVLASNVVDLRVNYRFPFYNKWMLGLTVNNVFNYHWQSFPGTPHLGTTLLLKTQIMF